MTVSQGDHQLQQRTLGGGCSLGVPSLTVPVPTDGQNPSLWDGSLLRFYLAKQDTSPFLCLKTVSWLLGWLWGQGCSFQQQCHKMIQEKHLAYTKCSLNTSAGSCELTQFLLWMGVGGVWSQGCGQGLWHGDQIHRKPVSSHLLRCRV